MDLFKKTLKDAGFKATPARIALLKLFNTECRPLSAEDIYERIKKEQVNKVTVYRSLTAMEKSGILQRVDLRKDSAYYELARHHHHHIICTECGRVEKFDGCDVGSISKQALQVSQYFSSIGQHSLEFFGVCKACTGKI